MTNPNDPRRREHADIVVLPVWEYLGGEMIEPDGSAIDATIPNSPRPAEIIHIVARGGDIFYCINGTASVDCPGYVPEDERVIEGPIRDLHTYGLSIFAVGKKTYAHIQYYRENI